MNLPNAILKTITKKGYKQPTPIQRKCLPLLMEGTDVVGMARTGSGKTLAFLVPLLCRLKSHSTKFGARGLILVPTRELAIQTAQVLRDLAKYLDLRVSLLVGGDSIEDQFTSLLANPDIIVGTPGRILHLAQEASTFSLRAVEYLVFDEADRLFELGLLEQIKEIIGMLPKSRQSCLFSATLPESVVEFAKTGGLNDPTLIRLDADSKVSEDLDFYLFKLAPHQKESFLIYLLENLIQISSESTIIFTSTKHHVEYLSLLLTSLSIPNQALHGGMDQEARNIGVEAFRRGKIKILLVTDVASRGIDIPFLDNVINYDFPDRQKLFVHRVGRAGRAGRQGKTWSFVTNDDLPYLLDLEVFLGKQLNCTFSSDSSALNFRSSFHLGQVPDGLLGTAEERIANRIDMNADLSGLRKVCYNGLRMYMKTRTPPNGESFKRAKEIFNLVEFSIHPILSVKLDSETCTQLAIISAIHRFKPSQTIFEAVRGKNNRDDSPLLESISKKRKEISIKQKLKSKDNLPSETSVIDRKEHVDSQFYIPYCTPDSVQKQAIKKAYSLAELGSSAVFSVGQDDPAEVNRALNKKKWEKKKGDYVKVRDHSETAKTLKKQQKPTSAGSFDRWTRKIGLQLPSIGQAELSRSKLASLPGKKRDFRGKPPTRKPTQKSTR